MAWERRTTDGFVTPGPVKLTQVNLLVSTSGAYVRVYRGREVNAADLITQIEAAADTTKVVPFVPPIPCENGIYVDLDDNVTEVLVLWQPG